MSSPDHDPFEERLRDLLRSDADRPEDTEAFISEVHRGARARRRRQVAGAAAAVVLVVGGGFAVVSSDVFDGSREPIASRSSSVPVASSNAASTAPTTPDQGPPTTRHSAAVGAWSVASLTWSGGAEPDLWGLVGTSDGSCAPRPDTPEPARCAAVRHYSSDDATWTGAEPIGMPLGADVEQRYHVSQLHFTTSAEGAVDGWAYGGGLLATHGANGGSWEPVAPPVAGAVTDVQAFDGTVYAVVESASGSAIVSSAVGSDDFEVVDTGLTLSHASDLVASTDGIALINRTGGLASVVQRSADGSWSQLNPCVDAIPSDLSTADASLWVSCKGRGVTCYEKASASGPWRQRGDRFASGSALAARSGTSALVVEPDRTLVVTAESVDRLPTEANLLHASDLGFASPESGFAVVEGRVLRTDDGGRTWTRDDALR